MPEKIPVNFTARTNESKGGLSLPPKEEVMKPAGQYRADAVGERIDKTKSCCSS